jgi:hypothetical protein
MTRAVLTASCLIAVVAAGACRRQPAQAATRSPQHVDSLIPRDVEVARFRAGLEPPRELSNGAPSRDVLVLRYVDALERSDTAALMALVLTRAEFAYLYYPTNPQGRPPYDLSPGLMWFMMQESTNKGSRRALDERGGHPLGYVGYSCDVRPSHEGDNVVWGPCAVRRQTATGTIEERLFGLILERHDQFKFVTLANKL